ncbi:MAG: KdsC family phosphatase [Planctomycetota bacterium]
MNLWGLSQDICERIKRIKFFLTDVDNVLTNGFVYYNADNKDTIAIHVHDGSGLKFLQQGGIKVGLISGRKSEAIVKWAHVLELDEVFVGYLDKLIPYEEIKIKHNLHDSEIAYVGDDLTDYSLLSRVGFAIAVKNAAGEIKEIVHYVTARKAGEGVIREMSEIILKIQGKWEKVLACYKK